MIEAHHLRPEACGIQHDGLLRSLFRRPCDFVLLLRACGRAPWSRHLSHCAETLKSRQAALISRRKAMVQHLRTKRGIVKRDFEDVLNTDHHSNASVTPDSPDDVVFAGNASCILQPETTEGPYCEDFSVRCYLS
jgi:hypothetical protein